MEKIVTVKASLYDVRYSKNGFSICMFTAQRRGGNQFPKGLGHFGPTVMFTAMGDIQEADKGTKFELSGVWENGRNGNEKVFKVNRAVILLPETEEEIVAHIVKSCKGVGKKVAQSLVQVYGTETIQMCAKCPGQVAQDFPKLSPQKIKQISSSFERLLIEYDLRELIGEADIPGEHISKIVAANGQETLKIAKNNPYLFQSAIGFLAADKVALALGEKTNSGRRIQNFIQYALSQRSRQMGSLCVDKKSLYESLKANIGDVPKEDIGKAFNALKESYDIVVQGRWVYAKDDFITERSLAQNILSLVQAAPSYEAEIIQAYNEWKKENSIELSPKQVEAVLNLKHKISIVTGGPGTGKSTVLKAIMDVYKKVFPQEAILLMAPTGLAAKRMRESTNCYADTIHSVCNLTPTEGNCDFASDPEFQGIESGFIGIDECSMIGTHLFDFAIGAIQVKKSTRIVLLGDVDQLPPVSRGNVLNDLIKCGAIKTTFLDCNFRQGKTSAITDASIKIRNDTAFEGDVCNLNFEDEMEFIPCVDKDLRKEADMIIQEVVQAYLLGISTYGIQNTIILTPTHYDKGTVSGYLSQDALNKIIQEKVNPHSYDREFIKVGGRILRERDRVIQKKNVAMDCNGKIVPIVNGDLGTIKQISVNNDGERVISIKFDSLENEVNYTKEDAKNLELAYAITVHSSQGCEFKSCIIPVSNSYTLMLTKSLYYTAITRAKSQVVMVGNKQALKKALLNNKPNSRVSFLGLRILKKSRSV